MNKSEFKKLIKECILESYEDDARMRLSKEVGFLTGTLENIKFTVEEVISMLDEPKKYDKKRIVYVLQDIIKEADKCIKDSRSKYYDNLSENSDDSKLEINDRLMDSYNQRWFVTDVDHNKNTFTARTNSGFEITLPISKLSTKFRYENSSDSYNHL